MKKPMKWVIGGSVTAAILLGTWWLRRRAKKEPKQLGASIESSLRYTTTMSTYSTAAAAQVARAKAGSSLSDYRKAENFSKFIGAPYTNAEAYFKSAYWLAVAARISGNGSLSTAAAANLVKGSATYAIPGSSLFTGDVTAIMQEAAGKVRAAGSTSQLKAVAAILSTSGSAGMVANRGKVENDKAVVTNTVTANIEDVGTAAQVVRGLVTGAPPPSFGPTEWFLWKWGLRVGIAGAILVGLRIAFSPQVKAAKVALGHLQAGAQQARAALVPVRS